VSEQWDGSADGWTGGLAEAVGPDVVEDGAEARARRPLHAPIGRVAGRSSMVPSGLVVGRDPIAPAEDDGWEPAARRQSAAAPPATWREHWAGHDQLLHLAGTSEHAAIYFDRSMDWSARRWLLPYVSDVWQYAKQTYGDHFGPDPLIYSIFHEGRYPGGHPASHFDPTHDHRNVTDCGPGPWRVADDDHFELVVHEIAHVVEGANNGADGSPAFPIWGDSKWAEFFIYDLNVALGRHRRAAYLRRHFVGDDDFPRPGTRWFRDWFHPLWTNGGDGPQVMVRFFRLLAEHYPRGADNRYVRDMNWGEYIHFTSGATKGDLTELARRAFGWRSSWTGELEQAQNQFPAITY